MTKFDPLFDTLCLFLGLLIASPFFYACYKLVCKPQEVKTIMDGMTRTSSIIGAALQLAFFGIVALLSLFLGYTFSVSIVFGPVLPIESKGDLIAVSIPCAIAFISVARFGLWLSFPRKAHS